jgi:zinc protease
MHAVVEEIRDAGISEEELQRAKSQRTAQELFGRDGPFAVASQLNEAIAAGDWRLYTTMRERIDRVTTSDVLRVAQTYLVEDARTVGWYVPS